MTVILRLVLILFLFLLDVDTNLLLLLIFDLLAGDGQVHLLDLLEDRLFKPVKITYLEILSSAGLALNN